MQGVRTEVKCTDLHHGQPKNMVCLENGCIENSLICSHCLHNDHFRHKTCTLEYYREVVLKGMSFNDEKGKQMAASLREIKSQIEEKIKEIQADIESKFSELINFFDSDLSSLLLSFSASTYEKQKQKVKSHISQKLITSQLKRMKVIKDGSLKNEGMGQIIAEYDSCANEQIRKIKAKSDNFFEGLFKNINKFSFKTVAQSYKQKQKQQKRMQMKEKNFYKIEQERKNQEKIGQRREVSIEKRVTPFFMEEIKAISYRRQNGRSEYLFQIGLEQKWYAESEVQDFKQKIKEYWDKKRN